MLNISDKIHGKGVNRRASLVMVEIATDDIGRKPWRWLGVPVFIENGCDH
ncbi:hypothetical protein KCP75_23435 [Salmonella enterica subsp. enterica]|nr:hypothetical protein KCP75_23435 [Salmonella enterica subsp. enterica]